MENPSYHPNPYAMGSLGLVYLPTFGWVVVVNVGKYQTWIDMDPVGNTKWQRVSIGCSQNTPPPAVFFPPLLPLHLLQLKSPPWWGQTLQGNPRDGLVGFSKARVSLCKNSNIFQDSIKKRKENKTKQNKHTHADTLIHSWFTVGPNTCFKGKQHKMNEHHVPIFAILLEKHGAVQHSIYSEVGRVFLGSP